MCNLPNICSILRETLKGWISNAEILRGSDTSVVYKVPEKVSQTGLLLVSTKIYSAFEYNEVCRWKKVASISSPYAEELQNRFSRDVSRIGTPELRPGQKKLMEQFKKRGNERS